MRFRFFKGGNPFRLQRKRRPANQRFAWLPKKMDNGTTVWFEWYTRKRQYGVKRMQAPELVDNAADPS